MSPSSEALTGGCLCRALRYRIDGGLQAAGHCHCSICRRAHGAAYATWSFVDPPRFAWTTSDAPLARYESSPGHERCFCSRCGSPLVAMHHGKVTEVVFASLDGDPGLRPSEHVFVASKAPWHQITDTLPQSDAWPPGLQPD
jgi:hypothetical protein